MGEQPLAVAFKLYPWEWMLREEFGAHLPEAPTLWLESPWKMLLSNKAILTVLWEMYPDSPYLLEASMEPLAAHVQKPLLGREGANVTMVQDGQTVASTDGNYGPPYVYQRRHTLRSFDGHYSRHRQLDGKRLRLRMGIREDAAHHAQHEPFCSASFAPEGT